MSSSSTSTTLTLYPIDSLDRWELQLPYRWVGDKWSERERTILHFSLQKGMTCEDGFNHCAAVLAKRHWFPKGYLRPWCLYQRHRLLLPNGPNELTGIDGVIKQIGCKNKIVVESNKSLADVYHFFEFRRQLIRKCKVLTVPASFSGVNGIDYVITNAYGKNEQGVILRTWSTEQKEEVYFYSKYFEKYAKKSHRVEIAVENDKTLPHSGVVGFVNRSIFLDKCVAEMFCERVEVEVRSEAINKAKSSQNFKFHMFELFCFWWVAIPIYYVMSSILASFFH